MTLHIDLLDPEVRANPYPMYAKLRQFSPVAKARLLHLGSVWVLARYDDVASSLKDSRLASDRSNVQETKSLNDKWWLPNVVRAFERSMVAQDDPNHRRLRSLVHQAFTPRMVEQLAGRVTEVTNSLLDKAAKRGSIDLIEDFALPLPFTIICEMMGVPDEERAGFHKMNVAFISDRAETTLGKMMTVPNLIGLTVFFKKLIRLHQKEPRDDLTTALLNARSEGHADLSEDEVVAMLFLLLLAGHETTVNLIGNGALALLEHPDQFALLREKPELIGSAVEELLRYANPVEQPLPRFAREEMTFHGLTIRKGDAVMPVIASANRDESVFENADKLDITRHPNRHVAFGLGMHYCLGAPLARLEGKVAIQALAQRFPKLRLATTPDKLKWRQSTTLHGLEALPVHLF